ncbi:MAG: BLUF domain-containing protein [Myxococcota bacterium]
MADGRANERDEADEIDLVQCIYMSAAVRPLDADALKDLLAKTRLRNERDGLTGMLLYAGGSFFQVLEGPAPAVDATYRRIQADARHDGMVLLVRERIKERSFADWTMGFCEVSSEDIRSIPGLNDFLQTRSAPPDPRSGDRARELLRAFRSGRWRRKVNA